MVIAGDVYNYINSRVPNAIEGIGMTDPIRVDYKAGVTEEQRQAVAALISLPSFMNDVEAFKINMLYSIATKLQIRRAMREMGIEGQLDNLLNLSAQFKSDWADAQDINLEDPMTKAALAMGQIDVEAVKAKIREMFPKEFLA